jgi:hypothetical protein
MALSGLLVVQFFPKIESLENIGGGRGPEGPERQRGQSLWNLSDRSIFE